MRIDARIPVLFGSTPGPADALLLPEASWSRTHPAACSCCAARGPVAVALDRLFLARVRGDVPWFTRVIVPPEAAGPVRAALAEDPLVSARFRPG